MIITIIFVFDPLAVLLLIASQQAFEFRIKDRKLEKNDFTDMVADVVSIEDETLENLDLTLNEESEGNDNISNKTLVKSTSSEREEIYNSKDKFDQKWLSAKEKWKKEHPNETIKIYKQAYILGKINSLPWESDRYK